MRSKSLSFFPLLLIFIALAALAGFAGCTKKARPALAALASLDSGVSSGVGSQSGDAVSVWASYQQLSSAAPTDPMRFEGSLRYSSPGKDKGHRVSFYIWSNGDAPYRMDLMAGFGSMILSVKEDRGDFLAYAAQEKKAYSHKGYESPKFVLPGLGATLPVTVADVSSLLQGKYTGVFGKNYEQAFSSFNKIANVEQSADINKKTFAALYSVNEGELKGLLALDTYGRPRFWQEEGVKGWNMSITYEEEGAQNLKPHSAALTIKKIVVNHTSGYIATIYVKESTAPTQAYTAAQLDLAVPAGTPVLPVNRLQTASN